MTETETAEDYYSDANATFGDRVAAARDAVGMDKEQLAKRLGVKIKTVEAWEEDRAEPRANKLQMLSGLLNVSMRWLLTGDGDGLPAPGDGEIPADVSLLLAEMRGLRGEASQLAERVGRLEKRLRAALKAV